MIVLVARPTKFCNKMLDDVVKYIKSCNSEDGDEVLPTVAGLALYLNVVKSTLYEWCKDGKNPEFSNALEILSNTQEVKLVNNGLKGAYSQAITKLMLANHGYSEKVENTDSGSEVLAAALLALSDKLPD